LIIVGGCLAAATARGACLLQCHLRLPVGLLDGGVEGADLLREVVGLFLEAGDVEGVDPFDFLEAVAVGFAVGAGDGGVVDGVALEEGVAGGHGVGEGAAIGEFMLEVGLVDGEEEAFELVEGAGDLGEELFGVFGGAVALLDDGEAGDAVAEGGVRGERR
jgi:hypothetical protein